MDPGLWVRGVLGVGLGGGGERWVGSNPKPYLNLPNPTFCRVPRNSILGFRIRTYKKVGFGKPR